MTWLSIALALLAGVIIIASAHLAHIAHDDTDQLMRRITRFEARLTALEKRVQANTARTPKMEKRP